MENNWPEAPSKLSCPVVPELYTCNVIVALVSVLAPIKAMVASVLVPLFGVIRISRSLSAIEKFQFYSVIYLKISVFVLG